MATHKSGFVNILGNPNVGKSTLMNALIGEKMSIVSPKIQTTRHRILGFLNDDNYQIIFSDTPGILKPAYKLQEKMMAAIESSLQDADAVIYLIEMGEKPRENPVIDKINESDIPVILLINKIDLGTQEKLEEATEEWKKVFLNGQLIPISALHKFNLDKILVAILEYLPESPPYYDKDELTDKPLRFFISEIIREKIFFRFKKEIPYSAEVKVDEYKESEDLVRIKAFIYVMRDSQKMILLGRGGHAIKHLGIDARKDIEAFIGKKVYLELSVKVNKDWRNKDTQLKRFGYDQQ